MRGITMVCGLVLALCFMANSCGSSGGRKVTVNPGEDPGGDNCESWDVIGPIEASNCGSCHNGSNQREFTAANFKGSAIAGRIKNGSMPPGGDISDGDKAALIEYLECKG